MDNLANILTHPITLVAIVFASLWGYNLFVMARITRRHPRQRRYMDPRGGWTVAGLAISAAAGAYGAKKQSDAAKAAAKAGKQAVVDPAEVDRVAREQARRNIAESLALEGQYAPAQQQFRNESMQQLLQQLRGGSPYGDLAMQTVAGQLAQPDSTAARSQLLADAIAKAQADLALGGSLDTQTRNEVTRRGLAKAGRVGGGQLDQARAIVPRDLGLTSMDVGNQRLATAGQFGGYEQSMNQADLINALNQQSQRSQLAAQLQGMEGNNAQRYLSLASFGQTLQAPEAGLSPGDLASLYTQNATNSATAGQNAAALAAQTARNNAQLYGQIGGTIGQVGSAWANRPQNNQPVSYTGGRYG